MTQKEEPAGRYTNESAWALSLQKNWLTGSSSIEPARPKYTVLHAFHNKKSIMLWENSGGFERVVLRRSSRYWNGIALWLNLKRQEQKIVETGGIY